MPVKNVIAQLRTTNLDETIDFYVDKLGFELDFRFQDFYAGIKVADNQSFHLKLVDDKDPSIDFVRNGGHLHLMFGTDELEATAGRFEANGVTFREGITETDWGSRTFHVFDDQGHVLCFADSAKE